VATIRTAVWVAGALVLTGLGRREAWTEAGWLVYPALAAIGLKILLEDLPNGRPATQFLAFGLYGAALIVVARARHRVREAPIAGA
jgi:membrane protein implicated in regulation of membrane protease activity